MPRNLPSTPPLPANGPGPVLGCLTPEAQSLQPRWEGRTPVRAGSPASFWCPASLGLCYMPLPRSLDSLGVPGPFCPGPPSGGLVRGGPWQSPAGWGPAGWTCHAPSTPRDLICDWGPLSKAPHTPRVRTTPEPSSVVQTPEDTPLLTPCLCFRPTPSEGTRLRRNT